ncbi:MAG: L-arabinose isomerase [Marinilabiliaceae bacterium]|jgi:L-arabinose isomerase|nr:L-arabinose isomerase [Marinilabiliaceae bacterium]
MNKEIWFLTGSQHLYGEETLGQVAQDSAVIAKSFNSNDEIPAKVIFKPVLTTPLDIFNIMTAVNNCPDCIGIITWMHTFSPAKMWINGLKVLSKPMLHLHTQFNRDIPWNTIDMDFMNLNQSAHGGREFGFINARMRKPRKVITGHWQDPEVVKAVADWSRVAAAFSESQTMKIARFGDNMRDVAVTEGDKVDAQIKFGYSVYGYGVGDLVKYVDSVSDAEINLLIDEYRANYTMDSENEYMHTIIEAARIEAGMEKFLVDGGFRAFTTTFEDLHGLRQLPGLAVQRLMEKGYGFGAEGDWKTAALVRILKTMSRGLKGGTSFMEDYTYHLEPGNEKVLGAHMLEVCPSVSSGKPSLESHPLGIGGKEDPARLIFKSKSGPGLNASLVDLGNRFRLIVNTVEVVECPEMPKLPVASILWKPFPDLKRAATAWILAGGAHHTAFSQAVSPQQLEDLAEMSGIEYLLIDNDTELRSFKKEIRWNEAYYNSL